MKKHIERYVGNYLEIGEDKRITEWVIRKHRNHLFPRLIYVSLCLVVWDG